MKFLYPLSLLYSVLLKADRKFSIPKKLSKPVISVGNITWGGTGKTPIVIEILNLLINNNLKPVVLTRGYSRISNFPLLLKESTIGINHLDSGDEPLLIAKSVPKASVIVGKNRYDNALKFEKRIKPDVYILDDGFQHWNIQRNLDIVCINAANPFGNGMLIPAGILREKPQVLKRADIVVITNVDMISDKKLQKLEKTIFTLSEKKSILTYYGGFEYKTVDLNTDFELDLLKESVVYSLSAVGFTESFINSIGKSTIKIKDSIVLRDHKRYTNRILKKIVNQKGKNSYFITTAKDAVKFQNIDADIKKNFVVLTVKPQFITGRIQWEEAILRSLRSFWIEMEL